MIHNVFLDVYIDWDRLIGDNYFRRASRVCQNPCPKPHSRLAKLERVERWGAVRIHELMGLS